MTDRAFALDVAGFALTEYQNYTFNSMANFDGESYGAGPNGIFKLSGEDDNGTDIAWTLRTGFIDGYNPSRTQRGGLNGTQAAQQKRLEEMLLAMRFDGPVKVRVWTDEENYYDYNVVNYREDVLHVVRAKLGKGLKSRYFRVELTGVNNTSAHVAAISLPMVPLKRRAG